MCKRRIVLSDFYEIVETNPGVADVYLFPPGCGALIVRNVEITEDMDLDIRSRFYAWCDMAELVFDLALPFAMRGVMD